MAKWKELGEVPDSDDESGFDSSQESEPELPQQQSDIGIQDGLVAKGPMPEGRTIWDMSSSSQSSGKGHNIGRNRSRPLLTLQEPLPALEPEVIDDPDSSPLSSPILDPSDDLENPIPAVDINAVESNTPQVSETIPPVPPQQFVNAVFEVEISDEDEAGLAQEAVSLGRSLRPRKPIQEHPYLLENVQYSKTLRSHGVRPLRVQIE